MSTKHFSAERTRRNGALISSGGSIARNRQRRANLATSNSSAISSRSIAKTWKRSGSISAVPRLLASPSLTKDLGIFAFQSLIESASSNSKKSARWMELVLLRSAIRNFAKNNRQFGRFGATARHESEVALGPWRALLAIITPPSGSSKNIRSFPNENNACQASHNDKHRVDDEQANKVEWVVAIRDEPIVIWLTSAAKVRPELSGGVPLDQLMRPMDTHEDEHQESSGRL
jgi:hypothetical protein